jgi:hypothetical protein
MEPLVSKAILDHRVLQVRKGLKEAKVYKAELVLQVPLVQQGQLVLAVSRVLKVYRVFKVLMDQLVQLVQLAMATLQLQLMFLQQTHRLVTPGLTPQLVKSMFGMIHSG